MVDPLSLIYSELWRLQILEFQGNLKKPWPDYCETVQIWEFATTITQNIWDLESQPWKSNLFRMQFLVR